MHMHVRARHPNMDWKRLREPIYTKLLTYSNGLVHSVGFCRKTKNRSFFVGFFLAKGERIDFGECLCYEY